MIDSTSDARTVNNVMRHQYRVLSPKEKMHMQLIKDKGLELYEMIKAMGDTTEINNACMRTEEAVMWAIKHLTK